MFNKCHYCKKIIFKKRYFEDELICKECNTFVPMWTNSIRYELNKLQNSSFTK